MTRENDSYIQQLDDKYEKEICGYQNNETPNLLTRRWSGVRVLDLAKTAGGISLLQIMRHVSWGFCELTFFSEIQAILYLKWTIFDKNGVSFFSNNFLNISLI